ncbi:MAG: hypothetical protein DRJ41_03110 [Thermoprotei archaeon]|nr:MAG: hypothetical protein DRJ41_03110 [Thermoprotei archaeon]
MKKERFSPFIKHEERLRLAYNIRKHGFYVRLHAYEYIVGDRTRFVAIVLLEPFLGRAMVKIINNGENLNKIISSIKSIDSKINIEII